MHIVWFVVQVIIGFCFALCVHELGHYLVSGCKLKFRREGLRFVWDMPEDADDQAKVRIAKAGFGAQFLVSYLFLIAVYLFPMLYYVASGFLFAAFWEWFFYPTHSENNDFNFLASK